MTTETNPFSIAENRVEWNFTRLEIWERISKPTPKRDLLWWQTMRWVRHKKNASRQPASR